MVELTVKILFLFLGGWLSVLIALKAKYEEPVYWWMIFLQAIGLSGFVTMQWLV